MENQKIYYKPEDIEALKQEFPACAVWIQEQADNLTTYYNQKPFQASEHKKSLMKIKRVLIFYNPNWEEQERIKEEEREKVKKERKEQALAKKKENAFDIFTNRQEQGMRALEIQPLFYDKAGCWWLWNEGLFKWEMVDEVDILNMIEASTGQDVISSKSRTEILNTLKQMGRKNIPMTVKPTRIQFRDKFFDVETGEEIKVTSEYFAVNPIPYELHKDKIESTPVMDKIFEEWVGKDNVKILYEILAYCLIPDYPIHRLFCFIGSGLNGKSCYLKLLKKFIGEDNITSTELDTLMNSRFEVTRLYKKLVCIMGETNFSELSKTSIIKKLTGQDLIGFEFKNKTPFIGNNYAKILIATNSLPTTTDKTIGFYRRWTIIDFPNTFSEEKDILDDIPEEEYSCLALKCCSILHDLLKTRKFTNEGTIEERAKKYEDKSNFFDKFWVDYIQEDVDSYITLKQFDDKFNIFCKSNHQRMLSPQTITEKMGEKGIFQGKPYMEWWENDTKIKKQVRAWVGIKWK